MGCNPKSTVDDGVVHQNMKRLIRRLHIGKPAFVVMAIVGKRYGANF